MATSRRRRRYPSEDKVVRIHAALVESKALARVSPKVVIHHLVGLSGGRAVAVAMRERIEAIGQSLDAFRACNWLNVWFEDFGRPIEQRRVGPAISEVLDSVAALISKEMDFVRDQVVVPAIPPGMKEAVRKASLSDKPYSKVPFFRPSAEIMQALDAVRVQRPTAKE